MKRVRHRGNGWGKQRKRLGSKMVERAEITRNGDGGVGGGVERDTTLLLEAIRCSDMLRTLRFRCLVVIICLRS